MNFNKLVSKSKLTKDDKLKFLMFNYNEIYDYEAKNHEKFEKWGKKAYYEAN